MRLLVTGDRDWTNTDIVTTELSNLVSAIDVLIHGNARGLDRIAADIARVWKIKLESYPAKWTEYGKSAGPIRNRLMLKEGKPDMVLAFHNNISESKGTKDMINWALKKGVPVYLVTETNSATQITEPIK